MQLLDPFRTIDAWIKTGMCRLRRFKPDGKAVVRFIVY